MSVSITIIVAVFLGYNLVFSQFIGISETKDKESELPKNEIIFDSPDKSYIVGQKISFSITTVTFYCEKIFDVKIVNYDYSKIIWNESTSPKCTKFENQVISKAEFPLVTPIIIDKPGEYRVDMQIESLGPHIGELFTVVSEQNSE